MNIDNVLAHAQQLMLNEGFWQKVDANTPGTLNGAKSREAKMFKEGVNTNNVQQLQFTPPTIDPSKSKMDKSILESFAKTPSQSGVINSSDYAGQIPASYLQGLNGTTPTAQTNGGEKQIPNIQYTRKAPQLNEMIQQPQGQYVPQQSAAIDYNYIKFLIDESIKSYFSNNPLNESANLTGIKMSGGNKMHFVDTKGNIYEATLKLVKKKA